MWTARLRCSTASRTGPWATCIKRLGDTWVPHGSHRTASSYNSFRTYVNVSTNQAASSAVASDTQPATIDVQHAEFVAQAKAKSRFEADKGKSQGNPEGKLAGGEGLSTSGQAVKGFASAMQNGECASSQSGAHSGTYTGRLSSTSSHLFKLIVPLPPSLHAALGIQGSDSASSPPSKVVDTAFLLHPSQPLSHVSRLILGSLPASERDADVEFRAVSGRDHAAYPSPTKGTEEADETTDDEGGPLLYERNPEGEDLQEVRWSTSTDLGDFIKQATLAQHFRIVLKPSWEAGMGQSTPLLKDRVPTVKVVGSGSAEHSEHPEKQSESTSQSSKDESVADFPELSLKIMIPSFESRTRFLRKRLLHLTRQIAEVTQKKKEYVTSRERNNRCGMGSDKGLIDCPRRLDTTAHKGARRIAVGGLMGLVGYWGVVFKLSMAQSLGEGQLADCAGLLSCPLSSHPLAFYSSYGWDLMEPVTYLSGLSTLIISYLFFLYVSRATLRFLLNDVYCRALRSVAALLDAAVFYLHADLLCLASNEISITAKVGTVQNASLLARLCSLRNVSFILQRTRPFGLCETEGTV